MKQYIIINEETGEAREVYTCDGCGCIIEDIEDAVELGDYHLCPDCDGEYVVCEDCGELVREDDTELVNDSTIVCSECLENDDRYFRCNHCEDWYTTNRRTLSDEFGIGICWNCDDNYYTCDECGRIIHYDDVYSPEDDDDVHYCYNCWNGSRRHRNGINNYSYKPDPVFGCKDEAVDGSERYNGHDLMFGVELEIDRGSCRHDCASEINDLTSRVYLKNDGSLVDDGFEIVSHPCTLDYHTDVMPWQKIMQVAKEYGYTSHDAKTCGLHFHVGREQLVNDANGNLDPSNVIGKIIVLVDRLYPFVMRLSRRGGSTRWCERNRGTTLHLEPDEALDNFNMRDYLADVYSHARADGRYLMVNVQNSATIEFRFFRGTLKYESFLAALQFISNICLYAKTHSIVDILNATPDDVVNYHKYPELTAYVIERVGEVTPNEMLVENLVNHLTTKRPKVGNFVRCIAGPEDGNVRIGTIGLLLETPDGCIRNPIVSVVWHNFYTGHSLSSNLSGDFYDSGWRVHLDRLEVVPMSEVPTEFIDACKNPDNYLGSHYFNRTLTAIVSNN